MKLGAVLMGFALCSCSTAEEGLQGVRNQYLGQKADQFFIARGPPASSYKLTDGGTIYTWTGGVRGYSIPSTTTVNLRPTYGGGATGTATSNGGGELTIACTLDLHADEQGIVRSIRVARDTIGAWQLSRCAEILNN
jgi:hypothetical protein